MVSLSVVQSSNRLIRSSLPAGLVAVFVGATSGIGEITLKTFAKYTDQPRVYFVGRSEDDANRIAAECKTINSGGEYIFIRADVSLIKAVDEVCGEIKAREDVVNLLFLSAGLPSFDRSESAETTEQLHLLAALNFYSRQRFIMNLLPQIQSASSLRRVVTVAGGSKEGPLDPSDFPAIHVPWASVRGHLCTMISLGLEGLAEKAPEVSFIHNAPGTVATKLSSRVKHGPKQMRPAQETVFNVPIEECGERQLYLSTSAMFPAATIQSTMVPTGVGLQVAKGTTGKMGSGVYSVQWDCESAPRNVDELLASLRDNGMIDKLQRHMMEQFQRITGAHQGV